MKLLLSAILLIFCAQCIAQTGRVERADRVNSWVDRYEIKYGNDIGFVGFSPKYRSEIFEYFSALDSVGLSPKEMYDRKLILQELSEYTKPVEHEKTTWWKQFYRNKSYLFEFQKKDIWLTINPILYLRGGLENEGSIVLQNTRGARIRGSLGKKIYFSSSIYENQASFQAYHEQRIDRFKTIPGQALYKDFDFNINNKAYDFLNADGVVGMNFNRFFSLELGHGKNYVGHGMRSLILSDYATNYLFLRANTRFWKFNYQNLFTELTPFSGRLIDGDKLLSKKYMAQHVLSFKLNRRIELGVVETVIFEREDYFEFQYLNPVIFYRAVEQFLDSADNIIIGLQGKYNFIDGYQLYGQIVIDEFNLNQLREDWNWFANTTGLQLGLKAVDFLQIDHLDVQMEMNSVRPYVYSHSGRLEQVLVSPANFSHNSQPLAHPLGANFIEYMLDIQYRIGNKFTLNPRFLLSRQGIETTTIVGEEGYNFGSDILLDRETRAGTNNQKFLQGERVQVGLAALNFQYEVLPSCFIDLNMQYRSSTSKIPEYNQDNMYLGLGIRANFYESYRDY